MYSIKEKKDTEGRQLDAKAFIDCYISNQNENFTVLKNVVRITNILHFKGYLLRKLRGFQRAVSSYRDKLIH
jgi:hypothetical protein